MERHLTLTTLPYATAMKCDQRLQTDALFLLQTFSKYWEAIAKLIFRLTSDKSSSSSNTVDCMEDYAPNGCDLKMSGSFISSWFYYSFVPFKSVAEHRASELHSASSQSAIFDLRKDVNFLGSYYDGQLAYILESEKNICFFGSRPLS